MQYALVKAVCAGFVLCLTSIAQAGILYNWSGHCVSRKVEGVDPAQNIDFGCDGPISGTLAMPVGYVPGTTYRGEPSFPT